ncbi:hypothetical protein [Adhaeribacter pallidiroseus]|uniref:Uncharacterized protein n=1 Tax=Adhaeribacter pallidiroseus TaxID=2072847 RepID=A0A369QLB9_9BACT|nr:hypothetical protein [Adhaeribacter pallidiroseus]RDC63639.1 hypothetical protein AHMF7616_02244 [Adhaeribacter pallidiroseus]
MEYPEEYELMAVFESEPIMLDPDVPFYYNKSTYKYTNSEKEEFTFSILPSYSEISINVTIANFEIANLSLQNIRNFKILSDNKLEKRIMLSGENYLLKIQLKPKFSIQFKEEIEK